MNVNIREEKFISLLDENNQTDSYIKAGYNVEGKSREEISKLASALANRLSDKIRENARKYEYSREIKAENIGKRLNEQLKKDPEGKFTYKDQNKAIELSGKYRGDFVDKQEIQHKGLEGLVFLPDYKGVRDEHTKEGKEVGGSALPRKEKGEDNSDTHDEKESTGTAQGNNGKQGEEKEKIDG